MKSKSDDLSELEAKMEQWIGNGARVAWLVDLYQRQVTVYTAGGQSVYLDAFTGTGPVQGFVLNLANVWRCFEV